MLFSKLETAKDVLDKCLKSIFSEHISTVNIVKGPKDC